MIVKSFNLRMWIDVFLIIATLATALWIIHGWAQNGRYSLNVNEADMRVLDARTGAVFWEEGGSWIEFHPQTGHTATHYVYRRDKTAVIPSFDEWLKNQKK